MNLLTFIEKTVYYNAVARMVEHQNDLKRNKLLKIRENINTLWLSFSFKNCKYASFFPVAANRVQKNTTTLAKTNLTT